MLELRPRRPLLATILRHQESTDILRCEVRTSDITTIACSSIYALTQIRGMLLWDLFGVREL